VTTPAPPATARRTREWFSRRVFLRDSISVEPLFNSWRAWTQLIPPQTAGLIITGKHIPLMESYIDRKHHATASAPYERRRAIDYDVDRSSEIQRLLALTRERSKALLELASAIRLVTTLLSSHPRGYSLEPLYAKVPSILRGCIELVYDLDNSPSIRFVEQFLYRCSDFKRPTQSLMMSPYHSDRSGRNLRTPSLPSSDSVELRRRFHDADLDSLFASRDYGCKFEAVCDLADGDGQALECFSSFFAGEAAKPTAYDGPGVRVRYFGHACVLLSTKNTNILLDPLVGYAVDDGLPRYCYHDLPPRLDYVLITHGHMDHLDLETLLQLRHKINVVVVPRSGGGYLHDPSLKLILQSIGFRNIVELDEMETLYTVDGYITGLPFFGEHSDLNIRAKLAYAVRLCNKAVLFVADSCNLETELYRRVHEAVGDVDCLFVGMECEGSPLSLANGLFMTKELSQDLSNSRRTRASNCLEVLGMVDQLRCKRVCVYAMGLEPWVRRLFGSYLAEDEQAAVSYTIAESQRLIVECEARGIGAERLFGQNEMLL
jgi:L-ascorbate metabolism protein UlaG (beta-lactamase superfamily)